MTKKMRKELPVADPILTSIPKIACMLAKLNAYEKCLPWVFTNFIQLRIDKEFLFRLWYLTYYISEERSDINDCPLMHFSEVRIIESTYNYLISGSNKSFCDFIIYNINLGYYIDISLEDRLVPGSDNSQFKHLYMIYGYDEEKKVFCISGLFKGRVFGFREISYDDLENSSNSFGSLSLYKVISEQKDPNHLFRTYHLDLELISNLLYDYLHSVNTSERFPIYKNSMHNCIWGISIYYELQNFYKNIINEQEIYDLDPSQIPRYQMDLRPIHVLWRHKIFLGELCTFLYKQGSLNNYSEIYLQIQSIGNKVNTIMNKSIKFRITRAFKLLNSSIADLEVVMNEEKVFIQNLIDNIKL